MKESYERTQLVMIEFQQEDVIITSENEPVAAPKGRYMMPLR